MDITILTSLWDQCSMLLKHDILKKLVTNIDTFKGTVLILSYWNNFKTCLLFPCIIMPQFFEINYFWLKKFLTSAMYFKIFQLNPFKRVVSTILFLSLFISFVESVLRGWFLIVFLFMTSQLLKKVPMEKVSSPSMGGATTFMALFLLIYNLPFGN